MTHIIYALLLVMTINQPHEKSLIQNSYLGSFSNASSFTISPSGYIFVTDIASNEIYKLDTLGSLIKSVGGYGWSEYAFDEPVDIFATTLNVYISDKNNNRIEIYDKDLNFLTHFASDQLSDQNYSFGYPLCSGVSNQGDLFILDSDNLRILKYNPRGELLQEIGSYESGNYMFSNPNCFAVGPNNKLFVVDGTQLLIFDQFGMGINKIDLDFAPKNINITFDKLVLPGDNEIKLISLSSQLYSVNTISIDYEIEKEIIDALIFKNKLYLLFPDSFQVIKMPKHKK